MSLDHLVKKGNAVQAQYNHLKKNIKEEKKHLKNSFSKTKDLEEAQQLIQQIAQTVQQQAHSRIAKVVSRCLAAIYQEHPYEFEIEFVRRRGQTEAVLQFVRDKHIVEPLKASGGGPCDIASFALRLACIVLARPQKRLLLVLDEPFKNLNPKYYSLVPEMLNALSEDMGVQFIITTNIPEYETGTIINTGTLKGSL